MTTSLAEVLDAARRHVDATAVSAHIEAVRRRYQPQENPWLYALLGDLEVIGMLITGEMAPGEVTEPPAERIAVILRLLVLCGEPGRRPAAEALAAFAASWEAP